MIVEMFPRKRRGLMIAGAIWLTVVMAFVLWNQFGYVVEETLPDGYDFGKVYQGSTLEFSARFLTSAKKHPLDEVFERVQGALPSSWRGALDGMHPKKLRQMAVGGTNRANINTRIIPPSFIKVESSRTDQRAQWYGGKSFVVAELNVDTSKTGEFSGMIEVRGDRRKAFLPVKVRIEAPRPEMRRLLISETPFDSDSTESGTNFMTTTELLSTIPMQVDVRESLPEKLKEYDTVLLAGATLTKVRPEQILALQQHVKSGKRLVLACNAFFVGTIASTRKIAAPFGLQLVDDDDTNQVVVTNIVKDVLTKGVGRVGFHRPSAIKVTDPEKAKLLVITENGNGYVAVARLPGGGELVIVSQSLWWWWLQQMRLEGESVQLMRNILTGGTREEERKNEN